MPRRMADQEHVVRFVPADSYPPTTDDGVEDWWMSHYVCSCGWQSHDSRADLPDFGRSLAEEHVAETGGRFV
jgi:hypothetical protein